MRRPGSHDPLRDASKNPPHSWLRTADPDTTETVCITLTTGYSMALSRPAGVRHAALREATFHAPYEMARLDKDAQDFRLEGMGPPPAERWLDAYFDSFSKIEGEHSYSVRDDARIFLRFPSAEAGAKATGAFVALNMPIKGQSDGLFLAFIASRCWEFQYSDWEENKPDVFERLETGSGEFPVVFVIQQNASGRTWDTDNKCWKGEAPRVFLNFFQPQGSVIESPYVKNRDEKMGKK